MLKSLLAIGLVLACTPAFAAETTKTWQGTWKNIRYRTTGPLKCTATSKDGKTWSAKFDGLFRRRKFSYRVKFQGKPGRRQTTLSGTATIDGARYRWTGRIKGKILYGKFRSSNGYYGNFTLREKTARKSE